MFSPRRLLITLAASLFVGALLASAVRAVGEAAPNAPQPAGLKVKIEPTNGGKPYEAEVAFALLRVKSPNGTSELLVEKVKSLRLEHAPDAVHISVEFNDHSQLTGDLLTSDFPIRIGSEARTLKPTEIEAMKFLHEKNTGLLATIIGLLTLTLMEIVLGIDNIIFLAIVAGKLPAEQQPRARRIGLAAALGTRLLLLCTLSFLLGLTKPIFTLPELPFFNNPEARAISWRDLILLVGGLFLIGKSTIEMREKIEHAKESTDAKPSRTTTFARVILQIAIIDIIFSLDSVITAVGMVEELWVMITAMIIAVGVMVIFAEPISLFVERNPTIKVLALSFLILIGVLLVAEGLGQHMDKGYIYFAMAFAVAVEIVNMKLRPK